jgi:hypothetical protein
MEIAYMREQIGIRNMIIDDRHKHLAKRDKFDDVCTYGIEDLKKPLEEYEKIMVGKKFLNGTKHLIWD